jgi:predicted RNase H-like HicB family nuclease
MMRSYSEAKTKAIMSIKIVVEPGEDSGFVAHVPALRGCWTQGPTREETLTNTREAIKAWLESAERAVGKRAEAEK